MDAVQPEKHRLTIMMAGESFTVRPKVSNQQPNTGAVSLGPDAVKPSRACNEAGTATIARSSVDPPSVNAIADPYAAMLMAMALGTTGGLSPADFDADGDVDGDVDLADFSILSRMLNQPTGVLYVWDAENRLIEVVPGMPASGPRDPKTVFTYDHMGRRVRKRTYAWATTDWSPTASTDTKYVYDGWRVIMEVDGKQNDEIARKYTWGLDLSGSLEGAGAIGGLLATEDMGDTVTPITGDDRTFIYIYDGNGNVGQLIETTAGANYGTVQAHYEYHLYGKRLNSAASGEYDQPYRFSTKPFDGETGLGYWGYRYYSSDLGRWMSRDPIGERGGSNVLGFLGNSPVRRVDALGREEVDIWGDLDSGDLGIIDVTGSGFPDADAAQAQSVSISLDFRQIAQELVPTRGCAGYSARWPVGVAGPGIIWLNLQVDVCLGACCERRSGRRRTQIDATFNGSVSWVAGKATHGDELGGLLKHDKNGNTLGRNDPTDSDFIIDRLMGRQIKNKKRPTYSGQADRGWGGSFMNNLPDCTKGGEVGLFAEVGGEVGAFIGAEARVRCDYNHFSRNVECGFDYSAGLGYYGVSVHGEGGIHGSLSWYY